jgi:hypothetical protein
MLFFFSLNKRVNGSVSRKIHNLKSGHFYFKKSSCSFPASEGKHLENIAGPVTPQFLHIDAVYV